VFANLVRPIEIVVSDDAFEEATHKLLSELEIPEGISVRHAANLGRSGQSGNVRNAFNMASFERLVLIHDDDFLVPGGLDALVAAWDAHGGEVDAVYGFQYVASASGDIDHAASRANNDAYFRRSATLGLQQSNLWAALVGQFPNNGYMIRRKRAIDVGYPSEMEVGRHVDHHFGIRYSTGTTKAFLLIEEHVSTYRKSAFSIARRNGCGITSKDGHLGWAVLAGIHPSSDLERRGLELARQRNVGSAIEGYLAAGCPATAAKLFARYWSPNHGLRWQSRTLLRFGVAAASSWLKVQQ
jgi:hypothetical protein